jgi:hypothetical protein
MAIDLVSYAYVEPGGTPPTMRVRTTRPDVDAYLSEHIDSLIERARVGALSPAVFRSTVARVRFSQLATGTRQDFVTTSQQIADRLFGSMDLRAKRGFFVTIRCSQPERGVALKLDVHDAAAAALRLDASGEPTLEAVQDLLDIPGELQKGAVVPDTRPDSGVIVGDRLTVTSLYFLEALDVQQHVAAGPATADFLGVVQELAPTKLRAVAAALEDAHRTTVGAFLQQHPDLLDETETESVLGGVRVRRRPIEILDPDNYALREEIYADGIVVRGRSSVMREKIQIRNRPGGFLIEILVDEEPRRKFI